MNRILIKPVITEKSMAREGTYVFRVAAKANKVQIALAIQNLYKVQVAHVNIINLKTEKFLVRGKFRAQRKGWKKAMIKLKKGQKIADFVEKT